MCVRVNIQDQCKCNVDGSVPTYRYLQSVKDTHTNTYPHTDKVIYTHLSLPPPYEQTHTHPHIYTQTDFQVGPIARPSSFHVSFPGQRRLRRRSQLATGILIIRVATEVMERVTLKGALNWGRDSWRRPTELLPVAGGALITFRTDGQSRAERMMDGNYCCYKVLLMKFEAYIRK